MKSAATNESKSGVVSSGVAAVSAAPDIDLFPARFQVKVSIDEAGCWLWQSRIRHGYGIYRIPNGHSGGRIVQAHRWAYEHLHGEVQHGLVLDHLCQIKSCVNPVHLEPVTSRVNTLRYYRGNNSIREYTCPTCKDKHYLAEEPKW